MSTITGRSPALHSPANFCCPRPCQADNLNGMTRFQFSLRILLAGVAAVGLATIALQVRGSILAGAIRILLALGFPALTATISLHTRGPVRAFWMGAFFASLAAFFKHFAEFGTYSLELSQDGYPFESLVGYVKTLTQLYPQIIGLLWLSMPVVGLACASTYWLAFGGGPDCNPPPEA